VEVALAIDAKSASRLAAVGIATVGDLLSVSPDGAAAQIKFRHISAHVIRDWQAQAELACSVPGLNSMATQLLVAVGVRDADELANADADQALTALEERHELVLRGLDQIARSLDQTVGEAGGLPGEGGEPAATSNGGRGADDAEAAGPEPVASGSENS